MIGGYVLWGIAVGVFLVWLLFDSRDGIVPRRKSRGRGPS